MGLPTFSCPESIISRVPQLLREHGLEVEEHATNCLLSAIARRGRAEVKLVADFRPGSNRVSLHILGTHILFRSADTQLTADVQRILSPHGVSIEDSPEEGAP